jgi:DNA mismatch repair protein MutL
MSDIIHLLPDHIANQIAAGEVIQRPASVVKELMENAIDAGATNVGVVIKDAGRNLIQVIDDGKGMSETDARMAFERHATSKISTVDDLFSLRTMGFRGEALASIAAVAQVELKTKTEGSDIGVSIAISGSVIESVSPEACRRGSVFSVKNLFYNVPARRKFLKSNETEFRSILTEFERVVLVNNNISFTLIHDGSTVYDLPATTLRQRILDVFGKGMNKKLISVDARTSVAHISGFTGSLESIKKRGSLQYFFVNGRYMRHPYFHRAVIQAYENMIPAGEMPDYMIYFTLDPATIDVNIHPTKTEIKFENERPIWQVLNSVVRESLAKSNEVPSINFENAGLIDIPVFDKERAEKSSYRPTLDVDKNYNPFNDFNRKKPTDDWKSLYTDFINAGNTSTNIDSYEERNSLFGEDLNNAVEKQQNPCLQYKHKYIITPLQSGLVIIDQHRAHVRILFEKYLEKIRNNISTSQKLLFPEIVEFTISEISIFADLSDDLKSLGFDFEFMGGNTYSINSAPVDLEGKDVGKTLKEIIVASTDSGIKTIDNKKEKLALALAKSTAIKAGKALTADEMELMIASLFSIQSHGITPDGNPVFTLITDEELVKRL